MEITFESFIREYTGLNYQDIYNLMPLEDGEKLLKNMMAKWIKQRKPSKIWIISAKHTLSYFGYEI